MPDFPTVYETWRKEFAGRFKPFRGDRMHRDVPNPTGAPLDPADSPEVRQMNLPIEGLPESDSTRPNERNWVTESNRSLVAAMQECVRRMSGMTDEEYLLHLDREYTKVADWVRVSRVAE